MLNSPEGNMAAWHDSQIFSSGHRVNISTDANKSHVSGHVLKKKKNTHHPHGLLSFVFYASFGAETVNQPLESSYNLPSEESRKWDKTQKWIYCSLIAKWLGNDRVEPVDCNPEGFLLKSLWGLGSPCPPWCDGWAGWDPHACRCY